MSATAVEPAGLMWCVRCETCDWLAIDLASRDVAKSRGCGRHVEAHHLDDERWAYRIQGIRSAAVAAPKRGPVVHLRGGHPYVANPDRVSRCGLLWGRTDRMVRVDRVADVSCIPCLRAIAADERRGLSTTGKP